MLSYVRQYALDPPTEQRQKRRRQKLKTFTVRKDTTKRLNTRLKQATMLLSSAYSGLQTSNPGHTQTFPLPLALCTPHGEIRTCAKSKFRDVLTDIFPSSSVFIPQCPLLPPHYTDHELIVDFLFLLHQPPPPDIQTFAQYSHYIWDRVVFKLGMRIGAKVIRIIVDKPAFLPKPRDLLHHQRTSRTGQMDAADVGGDTAILTAMRTNSCWPTHS